MRGVKFHCQHCGRGKVITLPIKEAEEWPACDECGGTSWFTVDQPDDQHYPYALSHNDRKFLRALRISADT